MLYSGTDPESYITEYTLVYEEKGVYNSPMSCLDPAGSKPAPTRTLDGEGVGCRGHRGTSLIKKRPPP